MNYFNQYQYDDLLARQNDAYASAKYRVILRALSGREPLTILNAGCGSGELSFLLAAAGHTVRGIDPAQEYIALARKSLPPALAPRCSFEVGTIEGYTAREPFDAVVATDVLEHIEDDYTAARALAILVKEGGKLIITVPAMPLFFGFHDEQLGHFRRYTAASLGALIQRTSSVTPEILRYFGWTLLPIVFLWSKLLRQPYPAQAFGEPRRSPLRTLLKWVLAVDAHLPLPFGTSLIFVGRKVR